MLIYELDCLLLYSICYLRWKGYKRRVPKRRFVSPALVASHTDTQSSLNTRRTSSEIHPSFNPHYSLPPAPSADISHPGGCTLFSFQRVKQEGEPRRLGDAQLHTQCRLMEGRGRVSSGPRLIGWPAPRAASPQHNLSLLISGHLLTAQPGLSKR